MKTTYYLNSWNVKGYQVEVENAGIWLSDIYEGMWSGRYILEDNLGIS